MAYYKIGLLFSIFLFLNNPSWPFPYRGVNLVDWSSNGYYEVDKSLERLHRNHVNFVAINVFAFQDNYKSSMVYKCKKHTADDDALINVIQKAKQLKMKTFLRINVDSKDGRWRGTFVPQDPDAWFNSYTKMLLSYGKLAEKMGVDILSIGMELKTLTIEKFHDKWRSIINKVRQVYSGKLVYCANWDAYHKIKFWDELDYIGIDAYFPLGTTKNPSIKKIKKGWRSFRPYLFARKRDWVKEISQFQRKYNKPIIFPEIGYASAIGTIRRPWRYDLKELNFEVQKKAYSATIQTWYDIWKEYGWFHGIFWWEWNADLRFSNGKNTSHTPMHKPAEKVMKKHYKEMSP